MTRGDKTSKAITFYRLDILPGKFRAKCPKGSSSLWNKRFSKILTFFFKKFSDFFESNWWPAPVFADLTVFLRTAQVFFWCGLDFAQVHSSVRIYTSHKGLQVLNPQSFFYKNRTHLSPLYCFLYRIQLRILVAYPQKKNQSKTTNSLLLLTISAEIISQLSQSSG